MEDFRIQGFGVGARGLGFRIQGLGFGASDLGFRVWDLEFIGFMSTDLGFDGEVLVVLAKVRVV